MKTSLEKIRSSWRHEWLLKWFFEGDRLVTLVQLAVLSPECHLTAFGHDPSCWSSFFWPLYWIFFRRNLWLGNHVYIGIALANRGSIRHPPSNSARST
mmetsp:Transcript_35144/g.56166  ORF Transcript_35144/g.56166 Transcript_35144/m.56166 type:complete len:98 (-) Transcript_35144:271-564(-)